MRHRAEAAFSTMILLATAGMTMALNAAPDAAKGPGGEGRGGGGYEPRTGPEFVNWESPQVHPLDSTPDGTRLLACNTADDRLEVFDISGGMPRLEASIPVGLDPVSVRVRNNGEAWVVNLISDSVSVVNLNTLNVVKTIRTLDEPCDVVFAGTPVRAFVSCSQVNTVQVYDPANLSVAATNIAIDAEDPRALAVSPDGQTVYAAIFESGNRSTLLAGGSLGTTVLSFPPNVVSDASGPYGGVNPPPNSGAAFSPAQRAGNGTPPRAGLIVKKNDAGQWMDDNNHDWTNMVSGNLSTRSGRPRNWDLPDRDLAVIATGNLSVSYVSTLMNICMAIGVNPVTQHVSVVGTDAKNEVRFEPNVNGRFLRVLHADVSGTGKTVTDLNPHLTYTTATVAQSERDKSVGDPRAVAWNAAGTKAYVAGMGSNNVVVINQAGARAGQHDTIEVGEGPTGLVLDEARGQMYVLNRFGANVSVVSLTSETVTGTVSFYDPTPRAIKVGRKHLYDTRKNSGLGQIACASCHVDSRMDRLAWDLGDPSGTVDSLADRNLGFGTNGLEPNSALIPFAPYHPMKGPMTTQTLQDIIGHEPLHWRGDRSGLENFNGAFMSLQGDDTVLTVEEMQEFEDYLATIAFAPNPYRNFDNTLSTSLPLPGHYRTGRFGSAGTALPNGNASNGLNMYIGTGGRRIDQATFSCVQCHTLPTGMGTDYTLVGSVFQPIAVGASGQHHVGLVSVDGSFNTSIKVPQIRNMNEKAGCNFTKTSNNAGFGYLHDGSIDSLERFVSENAFSVTSDQEVADLVAFVFSIPGGDLPSGSTTTPNFPPGPPSQDTHAAVGQQTTLVSQAAPEPGQLALIASMMTLADANKVGLVVKGMYHGEARGFAYAGGGVFRSDRAAETVSVTDLQAAAAPGAELTFTVVAKGTETRIGVDRDMDGVLDGDRPCFADYNQDGGVDGGDVESFFLAWEAADAGADVNQDGGVDGGDVEAFFLMWQAGGC